MFGRFNPRKGEEIGDQPAHPVGLAGHDVEETGPRGGVVPGRAAHGFDETGDGGERRAQLVAGIGEKVRPGASGALDGGEILHQHQHVPAGGNAADMRAPGLVRAGLELGGDRRGVRALQRLVDGGEEDGGTDHRAGPGKGKVR